MDFERLEEFIIIAECKSIRNAAQKLGLPVSTLSSRLNAFEKTLGATLFIRTSSTLALTKAGQRFYNDGIKIHKNYMALKQNLKIYNQISEYKHIRIGLVGSGLPFYLGPFLDTINQRQAGIRLDLLDETQYSIQEGLQNDQVDVFFAPVMTHITFPEIVRYPLSGAHQYVTLPVFHPLASNNSISIQELDNETFILYPICRENCIRDFQLENLHASGIHFSVYETSSAKSLYELLVPIGKGILISPTKKLDSLPNCVTCSLKDIAYSAPTSLFYKKGNLRPEVRNFINEFIQFVKENETHDH